MIHRLLVVDDEAVLLDVLKNVLKRYDCDVTGASDGDAAAALSVDPKYQRIGGLRV